MDILFLIIVLIGIVYVFYFFSGPIIRSSGMRAVANEMGLSFKRSKGILSGISTTEKNIITGKYKNKDIKVFDLHSSWSFDWLSGQGKKTVIRIDDKITYSQDGVTNIGYLPTKKIKGIIDQNIGIGL